MSDHMRKKIRGSASSDYEVGDWILADHPEFDLVRGYITRVDSFSSRYLVYIAEVDAEVRDKHKAVGYEKWIDLDDIRYPLEFDENVIFMEEGYLLNMIDFSLLIKDKQLFTEMVERLRKVRELDVTENQKA